ncbi:MAG: hypothetical protein IJ466_01990 [Clostridia bacterium]|nr:hypothetical protein [Clostridia bacterium]
MKKRNLKLLTMVLAVALSVTAIVGGTVAFYTDAEVYSGDDASSKHLDIALVYNDENGNLVEINGEKDNESEDGSDGSTATTGGLFANANYEPGYTYVVPMQVKNTGEVSVKCRLDALVTNTAQGLNVEGNQFWLSGYLRMAAFTTKPTTRDEVWNSGASYLTDNEVDEVVKDETYEVVLLEDTEIVLDVEETKDVYVAMWMPPEVDNAANHKPGNENKPHVTLGVQVFATQATFEGDYFSSLDTDGTDYDVDAPEVDSSTEPSVESVLAFSTAGYEYEWIDSVESGDETIAGGWAFLKEHGLSEAASTMNVPGNDEQYDAYYNAEEKKASAEEQEGYDYVVGPIRQLGYEHEGEDTSIAFPTAKALNLGFGNYVIKDYSFSGDVSIYVTQDTTLYGSDFTNNGNITFYFQNVASMLEDEQYEFLNSIPEGTNATIMVYVTDDNGDYPATDENGDIIWETYTPTNP